jgi:hypothetical protein
MKTILYVSVFICTFTSLFAQQNKVASDIPKEIQRKIRRDAARLAIRLMASNGEDLRYQPISIPKDKVESIYAALMNVYKSGDQPKSIERCNVHTFPDPSIDHIIVIFKKDAAWAAPLQKGVTETTSASFNALLDNYDLVIEKYVQWNDTQHALTIRSKESLNMAAIANEFYNIEGVTEIDLNIPKVSGSDIKIKRKADAWEIEYILKFGGAYSEKNGKIHSWKYKTTDNGSVTFLSETGEPIPTWMKCNAKDETLVTTIF